MQAFVVAELNKYTKREKPDANLSRSALAARAGLSKGAGRACPRSLPLKPAVGANRDPFRVEIQAVLLGTETRFGLRQYSHQVASGKRQHDQQIWTSSKESLG
eukprot:2198178-Rhodomonas_salina.2